MVAQALGLGDDLLLAEEGSQLEEVVDQVRVLEIAHLARRFEVVEDVVLFEDKLKQDYAHWPDVGLEGLFWMVQDRLHWHV